MQNDNAPQQGHGLGGHAVLPAKLGKDLADGGALVVGGVVALCLVHVDGLCHEIRIKTEEIRRVNNMSLRDGGPVVPSACGELARDCSDELLDNSLSHPRHRLESGHRDCVLAPSVAQPLLYQAALKKSLVVGIGAPGAPGLVCGSRGGHCHNKDWDGLRWRCLLALLPPGA